MDVELFGGISSTEIGVASGEIFMLLILSIEKHPLQERLSFIGVN